MKQLLITNRIFNFFLNHFIDSVYCLAYRQRIEVPLFYADSKVSMQTMKPSWCYWYADPILAEINGKEYVFVEAYHRIKQKGEIAVAQFKENGKLERPRIIIKSRYHMSFPAVFNWSGDVYMIPETSAENKIKIYKMGKSVSHWTLFLEFHRKEEVVDIIPIIQNGILFLYGSVLDKKNPLYTREIKFEVENFSNTECRLKEIYEDEIKGESALNYRNAGPDFEYDRNKYLVKQESTEKDYGMFLNFYLLECKESARNTKQFVRRISVDHYQLNLKRLLYRAIGTHTYGISQNYEIVDVACTKLSVYPLLRKIRNLFSR